jgi:hypothetical protein
MVEDYDVPKRSRDLFATGINFEGIWVDGQEVTTWVLQQSNMKLSMLNQITSGSRWEFDSVVPFYHWLHKVSGQGWLLQPML